MANTLTSIMHKILARGLITLREQAVMPRLVNGSYGTEAARFGATIDVPVPSEQSASDVTPSNTPPTPTSNTNTTVQIQLNNWKKSNFHLSDKDMMEVDRNEHFLPMQTQEAVRALANVVNEDIHAEYVGVYGASNAVYNTSSSTPFGTANVVTDATNLRKQLHKQRAPKANRRAVLDFDAEANALSQSPFSDAEKVGSADVKIEGEIGRKFGLDWYADDAVTTHTYGDLRDGSSDRTCAINSASVAIGDTTVAMDAVSLSGSIKIGDTFMVAGDTQRYVVTADATAATNALASVAFQPAAKVAWADDAVVQWDGDYAVGGDTAVINLGFHRDAFAFANRPLADSSRALELGNRIATMTDPQTGITLRLEVSRQYKQVVWEYDLLWGAKLVRPELACRMLG